jgi:uncharacterized membrane protein (GlpM family)
MAGFAGGTNRQGGRSEKRIEHLLGWWNLVPSLFYVRNMFFLVFRLDIKFGHQLWASILNWPVVAPKA